MFSWVKKKKNKKVFVGISGGVDSAVSAALLKDQGYGVVGVYLRTWQPDWIQCTWQDERRDAMRICAHLDIPFVEHNVSDAYRDKVTADMIDGYKRGNTPNPDILCNKEIKFGLFFEWAMRNGADYVATGHYAQIVHTGSSVQLVAGKDASKDQSYFLWTLSVDILSKTLFPVGGLLKSDVRKIAERKKIPVAAKKDSQGICFIGQVDMKEFLTHYVAPQKGNVQDIHGAVVGEHDGVQLYTYGERHGFTVSAQQGNTHEPLYVIGRDVENNILTVGTHRDYVNAGSSKSAYKLSSVVIRKEMQKGDLFEAVLRYHGKRYKVTIADVDTKKQTMSVAFENPDELIASGQSIVLYEGNVCVGGGIVTNG